MPFVKRFIEPKYLSRKPLDNSVKDDLEAVTNATLVEALKQLACLVVFADEIFQDLGSQVKGIQSRTEKLKSTIERVDQVVSKLNAKEVTVPVGTLDDFSRKRHHYACSHPVEKNFFCGATRPEVVRGLYDCAVVTPVCIMRQIDQYRNDGCRSSKYFLCLPFFKDVKVNFDVEIEMRRPASLSGARDWLSEDDTLDSIVIGTQFSETDGSNGGETTSLQFVSADNDDILRQLPTPEEKTYVMSLKYPYRDVPIDVTGTGFRRMTTLRRSFIQQMENIAKRRKRGKRRNTVSGKVDNKEIEAALNDANKKSVQLSTSGTQTCDAEVGPGPSRGQVCFDNDITLHSYSDAGSKDKMNDLKKKKNLKKQQDKKANKDAPPDCQDVTLKENEKENASGFKWFHRKARNRNSIIGGIGIYEELDRVKKSRKSLLASLIPTAISENKSSPSKSSTDSAVATASSTVSSGSNKRANAKNRMSLPISTPSQTMAVAVKLRENSARAGGSGKEDGGQSSSGNWSATSSTRTSMESEEPVRTTASPDLLNGTGSQTSLGKDSALSERMTPNEERWQDSNNGYPSDSTCSSARKSSLRLAKRSSKTHTARWLRSLEEEGALGRSAGETTDAASSTGTITPRIRRRTRSPLEAHLIFADDGESSEFSVDTDGYYTSMHTDSGLRHLPIRGKHEVGSTLSKLSDVHERGSTSSLCSLGSSKNSSSSKKATSSNDTSNKDSSDQQGDRVATKRVPPPPPPRTSTLSATSYTKRECTPVHREDSPTDSVSSVELDKGSTSNSISSSVYKSDGIPSAVPSDSEAETGEKLKQKTAINTGGIPSLCVVTPNASDDEEDQKSSKNGAEPNVPEAAEIFDAIAKVENGSAFPMDQQSPWSIRPEAYSSLPRNYRTNTSKPCDGGISKHQTLPKSFARSAPLNARMSCQQLTNTWPRRPNQLVYKPELISVAEQKGSTLSKLSSSSSPRTSAVSLSTFAQPPLGRNSNANDGRALQPAASRSPTPTNQEPCMSIVSGGAAAPSGRPGARVTLDSSGQVIHSTGSLPRRSNPASPMSSAAGTPTQDQNPPIRSGNGALSNLLPPTRQGAYVRLDPSGSISSQIPLLKSSTSPFTDADHGHMQQRQSSSPSATVLRQYDSNTLPRRRSSDFPVPPKDGAPPIGYHSGTIPRRWNNFGFLRRETSPLIALPSPPEQLNSSKSGAYVRLDGHPTHLEPGTPSKSTTKPSSSPPVLSLTSRPGSIMQPMSNDASSVQLSPNVAPVQRSFGIVSPPAMPLMHQLNYRSSRIPVPSMASISPPHSPGNALPPYYHPVESNATRLSASYGTHTVGQLGHTGSLPFGNQIGLPLQMPTGSPPSYTTHSVYKQSSSPFSRPLSVPVGDSQQHSSATWSNHSHNYNGMTLPLASAPPSRINAHGAHPQHLICEPRPSVVNGFQGAPVPHSVMSPPARGPSYVVAPASLNLTKPPPPQLHQPPPLHPLAVMQRARAPTGDPDYYGRLQQLSNPLHSQNAAPSLHGDPPAAAPPLSVCVASSTPTSVRRAPTSPSGSGPSKLDGPEEVWKDVKPPKTTMSTDDLFAVIHQSKKKMNVKTDLDRSLSPASSRSSSPAFSVSSLKSTGSTKARPPETGILSPRSRSPLCFPGDRKSWAGDRSFSSPSPTSTTRGSPSAASPGDRRSWASDRLGPVRPTSMHDFKMLLLQAGRGTVKEQTERRQSASELLKSPPPAPPTPVSKEPPRNQSPNTPPTQMSLHGRNMSPCFADVSPGLLASPQRPTARMNLLSSRLQGKHAPGRARVGCAALHNRTDILSTPIMEDDCAEEDAADGAYPGNCSARDSFLLSSPLATAFPKSVAAS